MEDVSGQDLDAFFHLWIDTTEGRVGVDGGTE
jgi:hypothetical protein